MIYIKDQKRNHVLGEDSVCSLEEEPANERLKSSISHNTITINPEQMNNTSQDSKTRLPK